MKFDQGAYWRERGKGYFAEFASQDESLGARFASQEREFTNVLEKLHLMGAKSILEIGCGFGRITSILSKYFPEAQRLVCMDISREQMVRARQMLGGVSHTGPFFVQGDIRSAPIQEKFDVVFASEVFLHFPPGEIRSVLHCAQMLSNWVLIHIDPYFAHDDSASRVSSLLSTLRRVAKRKPRRSDWLHDYPRLYDQSMIDRVSVFPILDGLQHVFVTERVRHEVEE